MEDATVSLVSYVSFQYNHELWSGPITLYGPLAFSSPNVLFDLPACALHGLWGIAIFNQTIPALATGKFAPNTYAIQ